MPDWERLFGDTTLLQAALWVVAAGLVIGLVFKLWPFIRNAVAIVDALVQLPAFIQRTTKQLENSHITNLRDDVTAAVIAAEKSVTLAQGIHGRLDDMDRQLTTLAQEDEALWAELDNTNNPKDPEEES